MLGPIGCKRDAVLSKPFSHWSGRGVGYDSAIGCRSVIGAGGVQRAWAGQGTCAGPSGNRRAAARETRGGGRHVPGRGRPGWRVGLQVRRPGLESGWGVTTAATWRAGDPTDAVGVARGSPEGAQRALPGCLKPGLAGRLEVERAEWRPGGGTKTRGSPEALAYGRR